LVIWGQFPCPSIHGISASEADDVKQLLVKLGGDLCTEAIKTLPLWLGCGQVEVEAVGAASARVPARVAQVLT
jgi:hypothetical protein